MQTPENTFFKTFLNEGETISYVIHKHWWALIWPLAKVIAIGLLIPLFLFWLFIEQPWSLLMIPWTLLGLLFLIRAYFDWYYDVLLMTSESMIDIDWGGFFKKSANRIDYDTIEGVEYSSRGILSTIFKFGDVTVQLRSGDTLDLPFTAHAQEMQNWILEKRDEFATPAMDQDVETLKRAIKALLGDEMVKRKHGIPVEEEEEVLEEPEAEEELGETPEEIEPEPRPVIIMETREIPESLKHKQLTAGRKKPKTKKKKSRTKPPVKKKKVPHKKTRK